ncbi:hypothetical protein ABPG77_008659 [Micractinium sp. CCAP 211/92]
MAAPAGAWRSKSAALRAAGAAPAPSGPPPASKQGKPAAKPAIEGQQQAVDERMLFVASVLIGYTVQVQVKSGVVYEGIFHALRPAGDDFDVLLRMAKPVEAKAAPMADDSEWQPTRPTPLLAVEARDLVQITAVDVRMGASDVGAAGSAWDDAGGFGTDAAISRARGTWGRERELQRWAPDESDSAAFQHLEDSVGPVSRGWDQFAVNEAKFGVRTDYAEELYTTELNPNKSKISMAEAARIAAEIERGDHSAAANIHMLEERGVVIDDSQMDEEDRYGAVVRDAPQPGAPGSGAANGAAAAAAAAAAPRPNAWAAGRPRPLMPGAAPSAPISIDPRREANKLRMQMTAAGVKQTSPYGTPNALKRPSPLSSPLISDPSKLEALNLNPGMPRVDEQTRREFEQFKAQQAASKSANSDMFKKQDLQELKQFSQKLEGKLSKSLGKESSMPAQPPSAAAAADEEAAAAASPGAAEGSSAAAAAAAAAAASAVKGPVTDAAAPAASGTEQAAAGEGTKKSGLNPFAKSFNFNPNAKEFTPTFGAPATAPAAAAQPPAAPAPPATESASPPAAAGGSHASAPGGTGGTAAGPAGGFKQGPPSPMRGPMQLPHGHPPSIPMPDMRPDFRRMPRGEGGEGPHGRPERDNSFGRRREESRERGPGAGFDRRRDGRHYEGGPGMRSGEGGPPPPPPGKGPGGPQGMQMMPVMPGMPGGGPGQPMTFMVRPMPGQPGMVPMPMQPGMMPPGAMHGSSPGQRPMMMPQMMMMPPYMMPGGMMPVGMAPMGPYGGPPGGPQGAGPGGKPGPEERGD